MRIIRLKGNVKTGSEIAHWGVLILILTICLSANEKITQRIVAKGDSFTLGDYSIAYESFVHKQVSDVTKIGPVVTVEKAGKIKKLWPHNVMYPQQQNTAEIAVRTGLSEDVYIVFEGLASDGRVILTAKIKPMMVWLWIGCILIIAGFGLAIFERRRE